LLEHPGYGACLREWDVPQFAICKGHQLAGRMLGGAEVAPMRALLPGEKDPDSTYYPGFMKEQGVMDVEVLKDDPVLGPAGKTLRVSQSHAEELKAVPSGFEVLARSPLCAIQAMRRKSGPIFYATRSTRSGGRANATTDSPF
jgi:GMP synthase (glutamine-hydrolysing)